MNREKAYLMEVPPSSHKALGISGHINQRQSVELYGDTVRKWIQDCTQTHTKCKRNLTPKLPTRVIDLRDSNGKVRLLEPEDLNGDYITLSHCWGSGGAQVKTTRASLDDFKNCILDSTLCRTYRDAIEITRALHISFLWIDSLCIVQDDPAEWDAESGKMGAIYEHAYLTICATRAKDGNGGLFGDRYSDRNDVSNTAHAGPYLLGAIKDPLVASSQMNVYGRMEFEHHNGGKGGNEYYSAPGYERPVVEPLMLRAWAFQERLLSNRNVDFLSGEMVWECSDLQRCECTQADRRDQRSRVTEKNIFLDFELPLAEDTPAGRGLGKDLFADTREKIVTVYTELRLTFVSDKLPALSGISQKISHKLPGVYKTNSSDLKHKYIAGLWSDALPRQLLWYTAKRSNYSLTFRYAPGKRSSEFRAPSFSWASNDSVIKFHQLSTVSAVIATIIDIEYSVMGVDPFGFCRSGTLKIRAPLVTAQIKGRSIVALEDFTLAWYSDEKMPDKDKKKFLNSYSNMYCMEILHTKSDETTFAGGAVLPSRRRMYGLVLEECEQSNTFKRLGTCFYYYPSDRVVGESAKGEYEGLFPSGHVRTVDII